MSDTTKAALDQAIAAHIADECDNSILTGYVLHASHTNLEQIDRGATGYFMEHGENQAYHVSLGLAHQAVMALQTDFGDDDD